MESDSRGSSCCAIRKTVYCVSFLCVDLCTVSWRKFQSPASLKVSGTFSPVFVWRYIYILKTSESPALCKDTVEIQCFWPCVHWPVLLLIWYTKMYLYQTQQSFRNMLSNQSGNLFVCSFATWKLAEYVKLVEVYVDATWVSFACLRHSNRQEGGELLNTLLNIHRTQKSTIEKKWVKTEQQRVIPCIFLFRPRVERVKDGDWLLSAVPKCFLMLT